MQPPYILRLTSSTISMAELRNYGDRFVQRISVGMKKPWVMIYSLLLYNKQPLFSIEPVMLRRVWNAPAGVRSACAAAAQRIPLRTTIFVYDRCCLQSAFANPIPSHRRACISSQDYLVAKRHESDPSQQVGSDVFSYAHYMWLHQL